MSDYNYIVIGSGAGGGTAAWALSKAGFRVLLVERGCEYADEQSEFRQNEAEMLINMRTYENRDIWINEKRRSPYTANTLGGGTALYGAALLRPGRYDFQPGRFYADFLPRPLWEWPIQYEDLEPYYTKAEELYVVSGDHRKPVQHLPSRKDPYPARAIPLESVSKKIADGIRRSGYTPFRLPLAIDFEKCLRCPGCPGYLCPNEARSSAFNRGIEPARQRYGLEVWTETEAEELITADSTDRIESVRVRQKNGIKEVTADRFVVAAGAIGTPVLLQRSGLGGYSGQLGRNYMYHGGAIAAGLFSRPTGAAHRFSKQIGFTDLYYGARDFTHKLGYAQALPVPGPLSLIQNLPIPIPLRTANWLYERVVTITGAVEDLPQMSNRVSLRNNGSIDLRHHFHPYDNFRAQYFKKKLAKVMWNAGAALVVGATGAADKTHTAHQVGTARFGNTPEMAVLDSNCRIYGTENVFVLDGSFMPTSLGVGPALTIIANALRVSDYLTGEGS